MLSNPDHIHSLYDASETNGMIHSVHKKRLNIVIERGIIMKKVLFAFILTFVLAIAVYAGGRPTDQSNNGSYVYVTRYTTYTVDIGRGTVKTSPATKNDERRADRIAATLQETGGNKISYLIINAAN